MPNGFTSNWSYLKTELNWLERLLLVAVSRQRQERKTVDRIAQSQADRVSAHWWKGLMSLDGKGAYDEHRPRKSAQSAGYQQTLQTRIEISRQNGVVLLLPLLCDRLQLTPFEKNLLLMGLAPEVNQRYGRLYQYLQGTNDSELPRLELALRLLCRNDKDWQAARHRLSDRSPLLKHHLIQLSRLPGGTFLNATVQVMPQLVELLLSEESAVPQLDALIGSSAPQAPASTAVSAALPIEFSAPRSIAAPDRGSSDFTALSQQGDGRAEAGPSVTWQDLILPTPLTADLMHLSDRLAVQVTVDAQWGFAEHHFGAIQPGDFAILTGGPGTGKTLAASAIAAAAGKTIEICNLQNVSPSQWRAVLAALSTTCPAVLLIKAAHHWFGPQTTVDALSEWLAQRRQRPTLTLLSTHQPAAISPQWYQQANMVLTFPPPAERDRLQLWKRAFPDVVPLGRLRWACLATLPLTGGDIARLARDAAIIAAAESSERIMQRHVSAALRRRGYKLPRKR